METIIIQENDTKGFEQAMGAEMDKAMKHFEGELIKIRTGRAHTSLVEDIKVKSYDESTVPLKHIASLAAPDSRMITIQPWDPSLTSNIERAIMESNLGVTPRTDGKLIRIELPEMSSSRREELVKILHKKLEECRVAIRNIRKEFNNQMREAKKDKTISENFFNRLGDSLEKVTKEFIAQAEQTAEKKERDITTI